MKRLSLFTIAMVFITIFTTTIFHSTSLYRILLTLNIHITAKQHLERMQTFPWSTSGQVSLNFSNDFFHITSDKEWATRKPKVFQLNAETYIISMHQQYHCLDVVRMAYLSYHLPRPKLTSSLYNEAEICLEQLRQHMMCNADLTLEPTELEMSSDGTVVPASSGSGVIHRCKNWQELESAVDGLHV